MQPALKFVQPNYVRFYPCLSVSIRGHYSFLPSVRFWEWDCFANDVTIFASWDYVHTNARKLALIVQITLLMSGSKLYTRHPRGHMRIHLFTLILTLASQLTFAQQDMGVITGIV